jgi:uncharacterized protein (DUF433 family)
MDAMQSINLIAINPKVRNSRPYIVGTTVTVADVAIVKIYHGQDADGIAAWYDLSLPQVYAALAYYYDHKAEMDDQIHGQIRRAQELKEKRVGNARSLLPR